MGGALLRGIESALGAKNVSVTLCDAVPAAVKALQEGLKCRSKAETALKVAESADVVILAVKPGDMEKLCTSLGKAKNRPLYLSITAGIAIAKLEAWLGEGQRVIRTMPNTPALVGAGAAGFARGLNATAADAELASKLLGAVGTADEVAEKLLDAVTGLSGSGPAYVYLVIEALADAGVLMGLPRDLSLKLAAQTVAGAGQMVVETGRHPAALRDEVTSPGGTTIAGLEALEAGAVRSSFLSAVRAATERARELGAAK